LWRNAEAGTIAANVIARMSKNYDLGASREALRMVTRRNVLNMLGAGSVLATLRPRRAAAQNPAAQPARRRMIVDAQVHLWKAETPDRPWTPGRVAQLPEPFSYDKLVPMMNEAGVDRVVIVPPSWEGDRIDYAQEAVQKFPGRFGIMGRVPLQPQSAALLPAWKQQNGMLGIRVTFQGPLGAHLSDGSLDWFWPAAEKAGIPIMFLGGKMSDWAVIAERHPQLTLIIDHMGLSGEIAKEKKIPGAIDESVTLAKFANVSVKLSGAPGYSSEPYPFRDMAPHIHRMFDAFGQRRSYWGTDMTNSFAKATYRQRVTHFTEELPFFTEEDKDWVMGRGILERLKWA
jgi:predicted TIM-barrel fold metal-dependent hydrolase